LPGFFFFLGDISKLGGKLTSNFAKAAIRKIDSALLRVSAGLRISTELGIRVAGEGIEEGLQNIMEPVFRNIAFDEHNKVEVTEDTWYQFFIGTITEGLIEAGPTVAKNISNTQAGYGVNEAGKVEELIGRSLELNTKTEAYKLASRLADGIVRMNDYNVGELLRAYVEEGGDMAFMKTMPDAAETNADRIAPIETREAVNQLNMEGLADKVIPKMTQAEIEQSVQESIREKAATAPEALQKTVFDGMSALIAIESRVKSESGNINHKGIGIDSAHYEFMGYLRGETALDTTAWTVAETIKTVMRSETLTEAETEQLAGLLTKIVGDARLSEAYVTSTMDGDAGSGYNEEKRVIEGRREVANKTYIAPSTGKEIAVRVKGDVVVPINKVEQYMRGDVINPKQELSELNALRQNNRKQFDSNPENMERLKKLNKLNHNYDRSIDMAKKLDSIGLDNTQENNDIIFKLLYDAGKMNNRTITSVLEGPKGRLKMISTWIIIPSGAKYLSTIKLIPID
jgi:hypothetical protein